jgi:hypothetical protein
LVDVLATNTSNTRDIAIKNTDQSSHKITLQNGSQRQLTLPSDTRVVVSGSDTAPLGLVITNFGSLNPKDDEVRKVDPPAEILSYQQKDASTFLLRVHSSGSYTLVFNDAYHRDWRVTVDGQEFLPIPSNYSVTSFEIPVVGEHNVEISFLGQRYQQFALIVSLFTLIVGFLLILVERWRVTKRRSD